MFNMKTLTACGENHATLTDIAGLMNTEDVIPYCTHKVRNPLLIELYGLVISTITQKWLHLIQ